ncbi:NAD(P)/FAD-dependent oxidoreductase [Streptomonospora algeriensis]|uniref:NAD(P)/FAD-dependent oxidoreductase n=1 Tax=Streptomonospora algeriensis TaxID=995084 RepID=A0ABW3BA14_9ACTN
MTPRHIVVVGNGMVGSRFVEEAVRHDPDGERVRITIVGNEAGRAYNRVLLPGVISGRYSTDEILLPRVDGPSVRVRSGTEVTDVNRRARCVALSDGTKLSFDRLVLATGAHPRIPGVFGLRAPQGRQGSGVATLRSLVDCHRIERLVRSGTRVVVLGGGVLGLETARSLAIRGAHVSVVEAAPWVLPRQLDRSAAKILADSYASLGIAVRCGRKAVSWQPGHGLELDDGTVVAGDVLVAAAGVRSATYLAERAGIAVQEGIVVDDTLTTSDPRVHAIGDCAQHTEGDAGLVSPGWKQAAVLARLLSSPGC